MRAAGKPFRWPHTQGFKRQPWTCLALHSAQPALRFARLSLAGLHCIPLVKVRLARRRAQAPSDRPGRSTPRSSRPKWRSTPWTPTRRLEAPWTLLIYEECRFVAFWSQPGQPPEAGQLVQPQPPGRWRFLVRLARPRIPHGSAPSSGQALSGARFARSLDSASPWGLPLACGGTALPHRAETVGSRPAGAGAYDGSVSVSGVRGGVAPDPPRRLWAVGAPLGQPSELTGATESGGAGGGSPAHRRFRLALLFSDPGGQSGDSQGTGIGTVQQSGAGHLARPLLFLLAGSRWSRSEPTRRSVAARSAAPHRIAGTPLLGAAWVLLLSSHLAPRTLGARPNIHCWPHHLRGGLLPCAPTFHPPPPGGKPCLQAAPCPTCCAPRLTLPTTLLPPTALRAGRLRCSACWPQAPWIASAAPPLTPTCPARVSGSLGPTPAAAWRITPERASNCHPSSSVLPPHSRAQQICGERERFQLSFMGAALGSVDGLRR